MLDFVEFFISLISSSCAAKPLGENLLWNDVLMSFPNFLLFTSSVYVNLFLSSLFCAVVFDFCCSGASTDENGENFILINSKFQNSPKEAIACLIAHESVHVLPQATMAEEVQATTVEVQTWLKVRANVTNTNDKLVQREMKLADNYEADNNRIAQAIASNSFYQAQLAK